MTTTDLEVHDQAGVLLHAEPTLADKIAFAKALAEASLLPKAYVRQPANLLLAQEYATAMDLPLTTVVQQVFVVDGKLSASAQLIGGLVRRAGHRLRVTGTDTVAVAEIVRCDDPDFVFRAEWTLDRAKAAGLAGKGVWKSYPAAMLKARAITEVARDACPEALSGVAYTPEELGASVNREGSPLAAEPLRPSKTEAARVERESAEHWTELADAASTVDEVRAVWHQAKDAGALTADLSDRLNAKAAQLLAQDTPDPEHDADVLDAEVVDEGATGD